MDLREDSGQIVIPYSYPVEISRKNASVLIDDFELVIPINLARIRELASRITNDLILGENYLDAISEEGEIEWEQARANPNSEKLFTTAEVYTEPLTDLTGVVYNEKNILFKI